MPFTTPLVVRRVDSITWELMAPLSYQGRVDHWTVQSGYRTDFATVPWFAQWLIPRTGLWTLVAVLHDWLITDGIPAGVVTSRQADGVFRRILREEGVDVMRRWLMWMAVRIAAPFSRHRRPSEFGRDTPAVLSISVLVLASCAAAIAVADRTAHSVIDLLTT